MRIAVNTNDYEILNSIIRAAKEHGNTVAITKFEKSLFDNIESAEIDAYVLSSDSSYAQKAVDYIKKEYPYTPIVLIGNTKTYSVTSSDMVIPYEENNDTDFFAKAVLHNIYVFNKNFEILQKLTAKMGDEIEFGNCKYDPIKRLIFKDGVQVHKLSPKQAGVFEILALNFGKVVKKDMILEKVWRQSNYFVGRSLDVFVTHLRKILQNGGIEMEITNVSNIGLMLGYSSNKK